MGRLERWSLLALLWTSAALATPSVDSISRRDTDKCPDKYTSKNGLRFTTYCEKNNPFNDAMDPFKVDTMEECMERCSRYWGAGEGCFGIVWKEDNNCWIRNSTTSTKGIVDEDGAHSALVDRSQMKGYETDCPAPDASVHSLPNATGVSYTVHCNKDDPFHDTCFQGYPSCNDNPFMAFYHAKSMDECLGYCAVEHPLCQAVIYNPGLEMGFANCWMKTGFDNSLPAPAQRLGVLHAATITQVDTIDTKCPDSDTYVAPGSNKNFNIHCGQLNGGTNMTSIHAQNITSCMDSCANSTSNCVAIVFDSSLQGGYKNCYLQNTTSVITDQASATYAVVSGTAKPSGGSSSDGSDGSSSKAWIAGPVIGGILGLALIGAAIWWWRRRKAAAAAPAPGVAEKDSQPYTGQQSAYAPVPQYQYAAAPSELGGTAAHEMDGTVKYAHAKSSAPSQPPQELPS